MTENSDQRKRCPNCGHSNRATAKNCTQCGFAFFLASSDGILRKRCSLCGHMNRLGAKVCSQCGSAFQGHILSAPNQRQKWCPQCGAKRRDTAKVCSRCGYRFKVPPMESPVIQSDTLGEPIVSQKITTSTPEPKKHDLSGEPAPYLSKDELERLRRVGTASPGTFVRIFQILRDNQN